MANLPKKIKKIKKLIRDIGNILEILNDEHPSDEILDIYRALEDIFDILESEE